MMKWQCGNSEVATWQRVGNCYFDWKIHQLFYWSAIFKFLLIWQVLAFIDLTNFADSSPSSVVQFGRHLTSPCWKTKRKVWVSHFWNGSHASPHQRHTVFTIELWARPINCKKKLQIFFVKTGHHHCLLFSAI